MVWQRPPQTFGLIAPLFSPTAFLIYRFLTILLLFSNFPFFLHRYSQVFFELGRRNAISLSIYFSHAVVLSHQTSKIGFSYICWRFSTTRMSHSHLSDVFAYAQNFVFLKIVRVQPERSLRIYVYGVIHYLNCLKKRNVDYFIKSIK